MNIDLANIDFVPGQGGGGITPSTPEVAPLFNKQDGYLNYNLIVPGYGETWIGNANFPTTYGARYVFNVGDEVYNFAPAGLGGDNNIFKFNEESGNFELISTANGQVPKDGFPMWKTPDGVVRYGINYTVDLQTGYFEDWWHSYTPEGEVGEIYQCYINSLDNVILGTNGRPYVVSYDFNKAFVWDYNTNDFTITVPVSGVPNANYFRYHIYFNGKYIVVWDSVMYEFVEHFDELGEVTSVSFEVVSTPYFPLKTVNNTNVNSVYVKQLQSSTVYIEHSTSTAYQLVDGVWAVIKDFTFDEVPGKATSTGCTFKDYLFGYGYSKSKDGMIPFYNFGPKKEFYGWDQIDFSKYVTNNSLEQKGYATQEWVENQKYAKDANLNSYAYNPKHRLDLAGGPAPLVDGKQIATTDMCITNSSYSYPGPYIKGVAALLDDMTLEYWYYFTTPSGRIIYTNPDTRVAYEFNGTEWIPLQSVTNFVASYYTVELNDGLYAININDLVLYRWDDTNSDWKDIIQAPDDHIWAADDNTLRCSNNQKLVDNDGIYQWEEDMVSNYPESGPLVCVKLGQDYYYMNENSVYTYNEVDKSFALIDFIMGYIYDNHCFTYDGCFYYFWENNIRKVNPSQVGTSEWDTETDIYWSGSDSVYFEYDNKLWTTTDNYQIGYTYSITKSAPAAPTQNGTYVLKATVLNGQVTYSWVVDEVPQAVQITNQILE